MSEENQTKSNNTAIVAILGVIVFLLLVAIATGGYFGWKYTKNVKNQSQETKKEVEITKSKDASQESTVTNNNASQEIQNREISRPGNAQPANNPPQPTPSYSPPASDPPIGANPCEEYYASAEDFVIPDSSDRIIGESELYNLTPWQLKVARNEIYARHGRAFVHQDMKCYFESKPWYFINPNYSEKELSGTENKNVATILNYEKRIGSPLFQKDSGCH